MATSPDRQLGGSGAAGAGPIRAELIRKSIHLATVVLPIVVWFVPRGVGLALLGFGMAAALAVEWARTQSRWARFHFLSRTRRLLRSRERNGFAGATYMAIGYFLALLLFPMPIAVAAMLYNGVGDATAALVGKRWGRHRTRWGKSWEGYFAGIAANLSIGLAIPGIPALAAFIGAVGAATVEFAPLPLDDNLRVTLGGGLLAWAGLWLTAVGS
jgi:dolichol kinase